jgi:RHS repeat-associated protein
LSGGLPLLLSDDANSYLYGPNGEVIEQIASDGTTTSYLHHDQLGSVRLITDAAGAAVGKFTYSSWGALTGNAGTASSPFGFAGEYTDAETGLQYLRSRYYDRATAQFITRDPLDDQSRHPYTYVGDDPVDRVDPTGLMEMGPGGGGVPGMVPEEPIRGAGDSGAGEPTAGERPVERSPEQERAAEEAAQGDPVPDSAQPPDAADPPSSCLNVTWKDDTSHIFRSADGHLAEDTASNRALLESAVKPENRVGTRANGTVSVYRETLADGRQIWVNVYKNTIVNGGINEVPR